MDENGREGRSETRWGRWNDELKTNGNGRSEDIKELNILIGSSKGHKGVGEEGTKMTRVEEDFAL